MKVWDYGLQKNMKLWATLKNFKAIFKINFEKLTLMQV